MSNNIQAKIVNVNNKPVTVIPFGSGGFAQLKTLMNVSGTGGSNVQHTRLLNSVDVKGGEILCQ